MSAFLPCPLCGHPHQTPHHRSKFKCGGCSKWIELSKDLSSLQEHVSKKAAVQAKSDDWWERETRRRMDKYGLNYIEARDHIHAEHDRNKQMMAAARAKQATTSQLIATLAPTPQTIISRVISTDDTTEAPW